MVIASHHQHTAMWRAAIHVAMLDGIAGSVDPGAFAVPEAEDAVDGGARLALGLLGAGHDGGCHILVDGRQKIDVAVIKMAVGTPQFDIKGGKRGAAISGNQPAGRQPGSGIAARLVKHHPHKRLRAVQEHPAGILCIAALQGSRCLGVTCVTRRRGSGERRRVVWCHTKSPGTAPFHGVVSQPLHCAAIDDVGQGGAQCGGPVQKVAAGRQIVLA